MAHEQTRTEWLREQFVKSATGEIAAWMIMRGYATGHGDTIEDLLAELEGEAKRRERQCEWHPVTEVAPAGWLWASDGEGVWLVHQTSTSLFSPHATKVKFWSAYTPPLPPMAA